MKEYNQNTNLLKIIACISMLIDHIGAVFFEDILIFRCIGRLAFPLFFFCIFIGYFKTKNIKKYILRLIILAIISQIPYHFLLENGNLNVCFSLVIELLFIYFLDKKQYLYYILLFTICLPFVTLTSYLFFVLFLTPIFYYTKNTKILFSVSYILFYISIILLGFDKIYLLCLLSLPLIITNIKLNIKINKYFFYGFYPIHIIILLLIKIMLK